MCTDGRRGAQSCGPGGLGWGPCECGGPFVEAQQPPVAAQVEPATTVSDLTQAPAEASAPGSGADPEPVAEPPDQGPDDQPAPAEAAGNDPPTPREVREQIRSAIEACHEARVGSPVEGSVIVRYTVAPSGEVVSASINGDIFEELTPVMGEVRGCIAESALRMRFPATAASRSHSVTHAIRFRAR